MQAVGGSMQKRELEDTETPFSGKRVRTGPETVSEHILTQATQDIEMLGTRQRRGEEELGGGQGTPEVAAGSSREKKHDDRKSNRKKNKDNEGKKSSRRRRATREEEEQNRERNAQAAEAGVPKPPRYPKRQSALLVGFCGSGYSGMQIQPSHTRTIEGVLFSALVKAGAVSQDNADDPVKVGLARAARTDAGVHAAGNLVSLKMIVTIPGVKDLVARVNEELPPEIRLWGYVRTQNSFNARLFVVLSLSRNTWPLNPTWHRVCDSRKYTYFFPSYLLIPPKPGSGLETALKRHMESLCLDSGPTVVDPFWGDAASSPREDDLVRKRAWRVDPEQVHRLRDLAQSYQGTHNFHNFTVGRDPGDRSNFRFMKEILIADPVVYGETEWISVLFHGQSFMLHQRKMICVLVMSCRTGTPARIIDQLYGPQDVFIPKMPSLGLLLEEPLFNSYNGRMNAINENLQSTEADYRPPIDFDIHRSKIEDFKEQFIYKNMREVEDRDGIFDAWMRSVDSYIGNDLLYFNKEGKIPPPATIKKGERRDNPFREKRVFDTTSFPASDEIKRQLDAETDEEEEVVDKKRLAETEG